MTLDEIAAAAEIILAQDNEEDEDVSEGECGESSDEGFGGEVESDMEEDAMATGDLLRHEAEELCDSGYGPITAAMETRYLCGTYSVSLLNVIVSISSALDEMGADALLCLATGSRGSSPPPVP